MKISKDKKNIMWRNLNKRSYNSCLIKDIEGVIYGAFSSTFMSYRSFI
jgi:hypothetical protein